MNKFNYNELTRSEKSKFSRGTNKLWDAKAERHRMQYEAYKSAQQKAWAEIEDEKQAILEAEQVEQESIKAEIEALKLKSDILRREASNKISNLRQEAEKKHGVKEAYEIWAMTSEKSHEIYMEELEELKKTFIKTEAEA